jgi:hypothetical protein
MANADPKYDFDPENVASKQNSLVAGLWSAPAQLIDQHAIKKLRVQ